ncbi:Na+/proline symporter [Hydrocarboniphaga daqingensis]|uniref:histidine kinase n=1 Tax=Hydrocarboniphaga daqingensis TaxID=490188 RepID=A0A1M5K360_9GAMM|nr:PAS domain-containing hybrid sensor histidine kinase/response regulator [Hydrocarboniphaga daqingensis]SHG47184.1 Na+/proline symporter [Hydrocarboniphaga daqingensis]
MLSSGFLFLLSAAYVVTLFGVAFWGDRRARQRGNPVRKRWTYSLALAVYCTSWTFYGAVGRAAVSGWDFLPIYLGPALVFVFGHGLIARLIRISKRHNITSIADFIGARYGRHQKLAMMVTLIAVFGVLPYIALQIKAVAFSFEVLVGPARGQRADDNALVISVMLAVFAILFGTRHVVSTENHHGMMLAIAFESVCKLLAFVAVGLFVCFGLFDGIGDAYRQALAMPQVAEPPSRADWQLGFITQTLLAAAAALCLPRQFHVTVVENTAPADLRTARWLFPGYLALISVFVLPIMAAGVLLLPGGTQADSFVLAIPLAQGHTGLALVAYLGGFSAATSMVIVATVALSTMICNEVVMPLLLRWPRLGLSERSDLSSLLKTIRRVCIVALVMLAYLYFRLFTGPGTLASIGLLSFSAVLHFLPGLIGGLYWRRARYTGAVAGLAVGFISWCYVLLLPTVLGGSAVGEHLVQDGPLNIGWLRPGAVLGLAWLDPITHGTLISLALHLLTYVLVSLSSTPGLRERLQVSRFLEDHDEAAPSTAALLPSTATVGDLQTLLERFFGTERARSLLAEHGSARSGAGLRASDRAEPGQARYVEHLLASAVGSSSARLLLATTLRGRDMQVEDVVRLLDETSHAIQFNRELLLATLEHLSQGVSVVDKDLKLVAWNQRYIDIFGYPPGLVAVGRPIEQLMRYNAEQGLLGAAEGADAAVVKRLQHMRRGDAYTHQRALPDGSTIEIRGNPMPGGGFVTSYSDVTGYQRGADQLREVNELLESRVAERTRELAAATRAAEQADQAKSRFLASASHDLVQPLNAARLFTAAIPRDGLPPSAAALLSQAESSLSAAESLLSGLLDISRLDGRAQAIRREHFAIADLLDPLSAETAALAQRAGLRFDCVRSSAVVDSDPQLLRRVLQNLLSNAVRYTASGRVLIGCRRQRDALRIEVWDTGAGIPEHQQQEIFQEFRRLAAQDARGERGMGLGLAIVERVTRMLGHPLMLRSRVGHGSVFTVTVPLGQRSRMRHNAERASAPSGSLAGARVLCLDNEPAVLQSMQALLQSWGCEVIPAADEAAALFGLAGPSPDLLLVDYHLDGARTGVQVAEQIRGHCQRDIPGIVLTADHTPQARQDAQAQGLALLPKPVKPAALRALMTRLLSQHARREAGA